MIASVEEDGARIDNQRDQEQENDFHGIVAAIDEVAIEYVGVVRRRQSILEEISSSGRAIPRDVTELNMCNRSAN